GGLGGAARRSAGSGAPAGEKAEQRQRARRTRERQRRYVASSPVLRNERSAMIPVPAMRVRQFGVDFYQAVLTGSDVQKLVQFEVLSYEAGVVNEKTTGKTKKKKASINWDLLEKRIARSAEAYQRPVIRKKIVELMDYYIQCADAANLPAIPGAVLLVADL